MVTVFKSAERGSVKRSGLRGLWSAMNLTDRVLALWFVAIGMVIALLPWRVEHWAWQLGVHFAMAVGIAVLAAQQGRAKIWEFAHDWYPLAAFTIAFEATARLSFLLRDGWQDQPVLKFEGALFSAPPTVWLGQHGSPWLTEVMEVGYLSFYGFFLVVAGIIYAKSRRDVEAGTRAVMRVAFRDLTDAVTIGYAICFATYLLFPTEGPQHTLAAQHAMTPLHGGLFHWTTGLIQSNAGVHGNAFPSGHLMAATITWVFAMKYVALLGRVLLVLLLLMAVGAVYDRYHYLSDVVGGMVVGGVAVALLNCWSAATGNRRLA